MAKIKAKYCSKLTGEEVWVLLRNNIKIYPVNINGMWFIEVNNNGFCKLFPKSISKDEINISIEKTVLYYYKQLK